MADLLNPTFEVDLGSWVENDNVPVNTSLTPTRDTGTFHGGVASMKLVETASGEDDFMQQNVAKIGGRVYMLSAWVNCTVFTSGASGNRGLFYISQPSVTADGIPITATTGGWVRLHLSINMPYTDTSIDVRLYSPQGTVFYDDISLEEAKFYDYTGLPPGIGAI